MAPKQRFTMRRAMVWVAAIALALAVLRYPVLFVQKMQRFRIQA